MTTLSIGCRWALGDTVCLSALVRDIHLAHPGKYRLELLGHFRTYWTHCPHVTVVDRPTGTKVHLEYETGMSRSMAGQRIHFLSDFHRSFTERTGIEVPVRLPRGEIWLDDRDRARTRDLTNGRYWVVVAGGKHDMTVKVWHAHRWQAVVDQLAAQGVPCVQVGSSAGSHFHPRLLRCPSLVGRTESIRDLFSVIERAEGVICGVTGAMHIAAAFEKPCVVVSGGREEPSWEAYVNNYFPTSFGPACAPVRVEHRFLHTMGLIDCQIQKPGGGCWRSRTVPLDLEDRVDPRKRQRLCRRPVRGPDGSAVPECLDLIAESHVVEAVMSYYERGELPPIGQPSRRYALPLAAELPRPAQPRESTAEPAVATEQMDHPYVGGRLTVFVLGYGDHLALVRRCLDSIVKTSPAGRIDLRVGLNQPSAAVEDYVRSLGERVTQVYVDRESRRKYPAMRQMFYDPKWPIETRYLAWFDDDSWVRDRDWLNQCAKVIAANHRAGCRMYGIRMYHDLDIYRRKGGTPERWFHEAPWWRGRPLFTAKASKEAPNGTQIPFAVGGFWLLETEAMRAADIPDQRLVHNGGDITIGCQLHQAGHLLKVFNQNDRPICYDDAPRRGANDGFPWEAKAYRRKD